MKPGMNEYNRHTMDREGGGEGGREGAMIIYRGQVRVERRGRGGPFQLLPDIMKSIALKLSTFK